MFLANHFFVGYSSGFLYFWEAPVKLSMTMSTPQTPFTKNFGLSVQAFEDLLQGLSAGDESLFEKVFLSQFEPAMAFLKLKYNASQTDAYDTVMWSLLRFRQLLLEGRITYGNMEAYFLRIVVTKYLQDKNQYKETPSDSLPEDIPLDTDDDLDEESVTLLAQAWNKLGELCRKLLKGFYYDRKDLKTLTVMLEDSSEANTRQRKVRCIKELRKLFFELEA